MRPAVASSPARYVALSAIAEGTAYRRHHFDRVADEAGDSERAATTVEVVRPEPNRFLHR